MLATDLGKHSRIIGTERDKVGQSLRRKYEQGSSIRELAEDLGRSYGFVHKVLVEADTPLRPRGGQPKVRVTA